MKILVSGCLMGEKVRYDGSGLRIEHPFFDTLDQAGMLISVCPECDAGLTAPRPACEITEGTAKSVLLGQGCVKGVNGETFTDAFVKGAVLALEKGNAEGATVAILKNGSPSCGSTLIYDGTFTSKKIPGKGVMAELLAQNGYRLYDETTFVELEKEL